MTDSAAIRYRLYNYINKEKLNQRDIAKHSGVSQTTISHLLSGKIKTLSEDSKKKLVYYMDNVNADIFKLDDPTDEKVIFKNSIIDPPNYKPVTDLEKAIDNALLKYEEKENNMIKDDFCKKDTSETTITTNSDDVVKNCLIMKLEELRKQEAAIETVLSMLK